MDDFQSADVIILQIYEIYDCPSKLWKEPTVLWEWRDLIPISSLPENTERINQEEDGDVNVREENNTLTLSLHWLAPGHTGVTKSYRFMADGRAGLASE